MRDVARRDEEPLLRSVRPSALRRYAFDSCSDCLIRPLIAYADDIAAGRRLLMPHCFSPLMPPDAADAHFLHAIATPARR